MRLLLILFFLFGWSLAKADIVLFDNGGSLTAKTVQVDSGGHFVVDGQRYAPSQIAQWLTDHPATVGGPHGIRFRNGRLHLGRLVSGDANSISLRTEPTGKVMVIPRIEIAEIIFLRRDPKASRSNLPAGSAMGLLLRPGVSPVPCRLDWIRGRQVAFSTNIGQFLLPMDYLGRYVVRGGFDSSKAEAGAWEVGLTDGSVFYGKIRTEGDKFSLLKNGQTIFTLPVHALRYARNPASVFWLPLWKSGKALEDGLGQPKAPGWALGVSLAVGEVLTFPAPFLGNLRLQAVMTKHEQAKLIVLRDGKELGSRDIKSTSSFHYLAIPKGENLTLRIESSEPSATAILSDLAMIGKGSP